MDNNTLHTQNASVSSKHAECFTWRISLNLCYSSQSGAHIIPTWYMRKLKAKATEIIHFRGGIVNQKIFEPPYPYASQGYDGVSSPETGVMRTSSWLAYRTNYNLRPWLDSCTHKDPAPDDSVRMASAIVLAWLAHHRGSDLCVQHLRDIESSGNREHMENDLTG